MLRLFKNIDWDEAQIWIWAVFMVVMLIIFRDKLAAPSLSPEEIRSMIPK